MIVATPAVLGLAWTLGYAPADASPKPQPAREQVTARAPAALVELEPVAARPSATPTDRDDAAAPPDATTSDADADARASAGGSTEATDADADATASAGESTEAGRGRGRRRARGKLYEWERVKDVLAEQGLELEPAPEGKRIAWVKIDRAQVFRKGELFPVGLNKLHALTRERIVQRELLFAEGDAYTDARVEESMRNLRGMGLFALVRIVPVRADEPDAVGVLVHTRDLWSLRFEQGFNISSQINSLSLTLVERNVAGVGHVAAIPFALRPDVFSLGERYGTRRTFGWPIAVSESGGLIFNRDSGRPEGGYISAAVSHPFYNLAQKFSMSVSGGYDTRINRQLANGDPQPWIPEEAQAADGDAATSAGLRIWREQNFNGNIGVALREGVKYRSTVSAFFYVFERRTALVDEAGVDPALELAFLDQVPPKARREVGPGLSFDLFKPTYVVFTNLDTFGQSENVRVGPTFGGTITAPIKGLGSTYEALVTSAGAGYTWAPRGALIRISGGPRARWQQGEWIDGRFEGVLKLATPMLGPVRLLGRAAVTARWNDTTNAAESLGSNNGLRGFPSQHLIDFGASSLLFNVELRTKPLVWRAIHLGGVLFYDTGAVFKDIRQAQFFHGFGIGIRLLLPQINRNPWVLDGGMSVNPLRFVPTITSNQVVPLD